MKRKILWLALAAMAAMPATVWSADISGEWAVEMSRQDPAITRAWYEFKVEGSKLTGSAIGFGEDERPILDGRVTEDRVFFTLKEQMGDRVREYRYKGKVTGDTINFTVHQLGGGNRSWNFKVKKVRP